MTATVLVYDNDADSMYAVKLDDARCLVEAHVMVEAHDKRPTWRKLKHPTTLARLQRLAVPLAPCPTCGEAT
jgi:hypothetical protein